MRWYLPVAGLVALAASTASALAQKQVKAAQPAPVVKVEAWNTFYTVSEFREAGRKAGTPVMVDGYIVTGAPSGGDFVFRLVDSVDKVLSGTDADRLAAVGAQCTVKAAVVKRSPGLAWSKNGAQRLTLYVGGAKAIRALHNVVDKVRVTGRVGSGKGVINPVTQLEVMDSNGDWKPLVR